VWNIPELHHACAHAGADKGLLKEPRLTRQHLERKAEEAQRPLQSDFQSVHATMMEWARSGNRCVAFCIGLEPVCIG
jgi:hypothetical protein